MLITKSLIVILIVGLACLALMCFLYVFRKRLGNIAVVDVGWVAGMGAMALTLAFTGSGDPIRRMLAGLFAGVWSLRLGFYLLRTRVIGAPEDGRYRALMEAWGKNAERRLFGLFIAQGCFVMLFALPFLPVVNLATPVPTPWDIMGTMVWAMAVIGESVADRQLASWRKDPAHRGKTCRTGLWRYSRHPNYFFEWVYWWTFVFLGVGHPGWVLSLAGPLLMFLFLYRFTGIPFTEAQALRSRGEDYASYQRTTSAFFPWLPRADE